MRWQAAVQEKAPSLPLRQQPCSAACSPVLHRCTRQVLELLDSGERHRHFGETKMNKNSSRSHTIFRMVVESRSRDANPDDAQVGRLQAWWWGWAAPQAGWQGS